MRPPKARDQGLIVADVGDEVVLYDTASHRAHQLNPFATLVWRHCDGQTTIAELTTILRERFGPSADASATWRALQQLDRAALLTDPLVVPERYRALSRRAALGRLAKTGAAVAGAGAAISLITSISAPTPTYAASCAGVGASCLTLPCCAGLTCTAVICV